MSTKEKKREKSTRSSNFNNEIVVYNDDVNTFDHVIETLIKCASTLEQAEQCSLIVHYNGKCTVKQVR
jgi:ATP-dependent Clp protease adaptor protein ClpS